MIMSGIVMNLTTIMKYDTVYADTTTPSGLKRIFLCLIPQQRVASKILKPCLAGGLVYEN